MLAAGDLVVVRKLEYGTRRVVLSWPGTLLTLTDSWLVIRASFTRLSVDPVVVDGVPFVTGDVFTEFYPFGRWHNIFHITDGAGRPKGWYCNVTRPPEIDEEGVSYVDMALDLFVHPDGRYTVLDEDEFAIENERSYTVEDAIRARDSLSELVHMAETRTLPAPHDVP